VRNWEVRFALNNGHRQPDRSGPKSANSGYARVRGDANHLASGPRQRCNDGVINEFYEGIQYSVVSDRGTLDNDFRLYFSVLK